MPVEDGEKDLNFMGIFEGANPYLRTQNKQTNQKASWGRSFVWSPATKQILSLCRAQHFRILLTPPSRENKLDPLFQTSGKNSQRKLTIVSAVTLFRFLWPCIVSKVWRERERKKPTRCNNQMFIINFCLNMFRASLCRASWAKCKERERKNQQDATIRCLLLTSVSTCFGHHYANLQENKTVLLHLVYCAGSAGCGW